MASVRQDVLRVDKLCLVDSGLPSSTDLSDHGDLADQPFLDLYHVMHLPQRENYSAGGCRYYHLLHRHRCYRSSEIPERLGGLGRV